MRLRRHESLSPEQQIRREVGHVYDPDSIELWLNRPNGLLAGRSPRAEIDRGNAGMVLLAAKTVRLIGGDRRRNDKINLARDIVRWR